MHPYINSKIAYSNTIKDEANKADKEKLRIEVANRTPAEIAALAETKASADKVFWDNSAKLDEAMRTGKTIPGVEWRFDQYK